MDTTESLTSCDKEKLKEGFTRELNEYYKTQRGQFQMKWDERVEEIIKALEEHETKPTQKSRLMKKLFDFVEYNGRKILVNLKNSTKMTSKDKYFDIIYEAHIATHHGDLSRIRCYLRRKVYIQSDIIDCFLNHCRCCKTITECRKKLTATATSYRGQALKPGEYKRGFVNIIDMSQEPDGEYYHILYYQDIATEFCFLRPLKDDSINTISQELIKLFLNLTGCEILHSSRGPKFLEDITTCILKAFPRRVILIGNPLPENNYETVIMMKLREWMSKRNSLEWSKGVHHVQFDLNCSNDGGTKKTPYENMFDVPPKRGFNEVLCQVKIPKHVNQPLLRLQKHLKRQQNDAHNLTQNKIIIKDIKSLVNTKDEENDQETSEDDQNEAKEYDTNEEDAIPSTSKLLCWVCSLDCKSNSSLCSQCDSVIHKACGIYDTDEVFTCLTCLEVAQMYSDVMKTVDMAGNDDEKNTYGMFENTYIIPD